MTNQTFNSQTAKLLPIRGAYGLSANSRTSRHERAVKAAATRKANQANAKRQQFASNLWYEIKCSLIAFALVFALLLVVLH